jgi:hypothetical protein
MIVCKQSRVWNYICIGLFAGMLLTACSTISPVTLSPEEQNLELETTTVLPLRGDPKFSENQLSSEARLWHKRLWVAITRSKSNATAMAQSGDTFNYARGLNVHITTLLTALRATGDLKLLDEIDGLMQLARAELKDYNKDGYLNFRYLNKDSPKWYGDDYQRMDEMHAHGMIAAVAYAYRANADLDSRYRERANFWTNYLANHFEAKWRKRNKVPTGYPFLNRPFTPTYANFTRYHLYMYKLTGKESYYNEALRLASLLQKEMVNVTAAGSPAYVWDRAMTVTGAKPLGCQPLKYVHLYLNAVVDLHLEGIGFFAQKTTMQKFANTIRTFVMDDGAKSFARDNCGGVNRGGLTSYASYNRAGPSFYIRSQLTLAAWDSSGKITNVAQQVYRSQESNLENPSRIFIPAAMVLALSTR